jgi:hypothetical protein
MPSSTAPGVSRQRQRQRHGGARGAYVGDLEVDGPVRVENVVEQVAVVVVAGKLGLEGGLELERGGGGLQLGVDVVVARDGGHAVEVLAVVLGRVSAHGLVLGVRIAVLVLAAHDGGRAACGACGRGPWWWWSKAAQNIQRVRGLGATCDNKTTVLPKPTAAVPHFARRQSPASGQRVSDRGRSPPSPPPPPAFGYHRVRLPFLHAAGPLVHHDGWLRAGTSRDFSSSASSAAARRPPSVASRASESLSLSRSPSLSAAPK